MQGPLDVESLQRCRCWQRSWALCCASGSPQCLLCGMSTDIRYQLSLVQSCTLPAFVSDMPAKSALQSAHAAFQLLPHSNKLSINSSLPG